VEAVAAAIGIVSVFLSTRQIIWSWPTALVNNALYFLIFYLDRLYALMGLQVFFAGIAIYGWYEWLFGGENRTELRVSRVRPRTALVLATLAITGTASLGWLLARTQDPHPYVDAGLAVVSLLAQWMMARKILECWGVWIGVNLVSVPLFLLRAEYPTALQYSVFLGLAISGLHQWWRSWSGRRAAAERVTAW
jgi:nicotinamide mononucleotide transporter